jgi:catechol 2,3-dioxygenase-like lactoylglutathione lyase family enzyme
MSVFNSLPIVVACIHNEVPDPRAGAGNPGAAHLALTVDDIHERYERLRAAGVSFVSPPNHITAGINTGGYTCYVRDPDDIVLEVVQRSPA